MTPNLQYSVVFPRRKTKQQKPQDAIQKKNTEYTYIFNVKIFNIKGSIIVFYLYLSSCPDTSKQLLKLSNFYKEYT